MKLDLRFGLVTNSYILAQNTSDFSAFISRTRNMLASPNNTLFNVAFGFTYSQQTRCKQLYLFVQYLTSQSALPAPNVENGVSMSVPLHWNDLEPLGGGVLHFDFTNTIGLKSIYFWHIDLFLAHRRLKYQTAHTATDNGLRYAWNPSWIIQLSELSINDCCASTRIANVSTC